MITVTNWQIYTLKYIMSVAHHHHRHPLAPTGALGINKMLPVSIVKVSVYVFSLHGILQEYNCSMKHNVLSYHFLQGRKEGNRCRTVFEICQRH